jgi:hypothetical protein
MGELTVFADADREPAGCRSRPRRPTLARSAAGAEVPASDGMPGAVRAHGHRVSRCKEEMSMNKIRKLAAAAALVLCAATASAQSSSYTPGSVWTFTNVVVEPGQFEAYLDWLSKEFKKTNDFGVKEGYILSYHVLQVNNARAGEPDLILAMESRDYLSNAQQLAMQKKYEDFMAKDQRKMETEAGERKVLRKINGSMELQELKLK